MSSGPSLPRPEAGATTLSMVASCERPQDGGNITHLASNCRPRTDLLHRAVNAGSYRGDSRNEICMILGSADQLYGDCTCPCDRTYGNQDRYCGCASDRSSDVSGSTSEDIRSTAVKHCRESGCLSNSCGGSSRSASRRSHRSDSLTLAWRVRANEFRRLFGAAHYGDRLFLLAATSKHKRRTCNEYCDSQSGTQFNAPFRWRLAEGPATAPNGAKQPTITWHAGSCARAEYGSNRARADASGNPFDL
jgi:hypothetical protein